MLSAMNNAIIGATGFVGTNLLAQHTFAERFNSRNIAELHGKRFDMVVCAAAPATMWAANKDPEGDLRNIQSLISHLERVETDRFVLISTIAVLADAAAMADENTTDFETIKGYGRNRRYLEQALAAVFQNLHIVRLPALYGIGLKKNFIFDISNPVPSFLTIEKYNELLDRLPPPLATLLKTSFDLVADLGMYRCDRTRLGAGDRSQLERGLFDLGFTALSFTNADSTFQYYGLSRLWADIGIVVSNDVPLVHLAPEPLRAAEVYQALKGSSFSERSVAPYHENMCTRHAQLWNNSGRYIQDAQSVLRDLIQFHNALPKS